ncbi:hypothetical protein J6590_020267 [Homalodisca vitripennis]|nr:hypothetical protein J6590_020267 [Homalodisca vitripennis]
MKEFASPGERRLGADKKSGGRKGGFTEGSMQRWRAAPSINRGRARELSWPMARVSTTSRSARAGKLYNLLPQTCQLHYMLLI